jgi:hypothetical protein
VATAAIYQHVQLRNSEANADGDIVSGAWVESAALIVCQAFLAGILVLAASSKSLFPSAFVDALDATGFSAKTSRALASIVPAAEGVLGLSLLLTGGKVLLLVASSAVVLFAAFLIWVAYMLYVKGDRVPCGCFGATPRPMTGWTLIRNVTFLAIAVAVLVLVSDGVAPLAGDEPWLLLTVVGGALLLSLAAATRAGWPALILTSRDLVRAEQEHG